jgi:hypothetical protein
MKFIHHAALFHRGQGESFGMVNLHCSIAVDFLYLHISRTPSVCVGGRLAIASSQEKYRNDHNRKGDRKRLSSNQHETFSTDISGPATKNFDKTRIHGDAWQFAFCEPAWEIRRWNFDPGQGGSRHDGLGIETEAHSR